VNASRQPSAGALFLDRDGTLIRDSGYIHRPEEVRLLPGVRSALKRALATHRLFILTNQSGIGRGYYAWQEAESVNARVLQLLRLPKPGIEQIAMASEHPEESLVYRKPSPRFILETIAWEHLDPAQCWMIGDRMDDIRTGIRAGIRAALLSKTPPRDPASRVYCKQHAVPIFPSLAAFAQRELSGRA